MLGSGGLGLTGGIADVGGLYDCLSGIYQGVADESILDKYSDKRREKYKEIVDPMSTENFKRLWEKSPEETIATNPFFDIARKAEQDKELSRSLVKVSESSKVMSLTSHGVNISQGSLSLQHDFTQYYRGTSVGVA